MSIVDIITRLCTQDLVYWALDSIDGYSRETFASPVELKGRWESAKELVIDSKGEEVVSVAKSWILQDVGEGGYLYLGTLDDLDSDPNPLEVADALRIIAFSKSPALGSTTEFERVAHMNKSKNTTV